jgi:hypothetical protein
LRATGQPTELAVEWEFGFVCLSIGDIRGSSPEPGLVTAGTIFNDSHLYLWKYFLATYLICESRTERTPQLQGWPRDAVRYWASLAAPMALCCHSSQTSFAAASQIGFRFSADYFLLTALERGFYGFRINWSATDRCRELDRSRTRREGGTALVSG